MLLGVITGRIVVFFIGMFLAFVLTGFLSCCSRLLANFLGCRRFSLRIGFGQDRNLLTAGNLRQVGISTQLSFRQLEGMIVQN